MIEKQAMPPTEPRSNGIRSRTRDVLFLPLLIGLSVILWLPRFRGPIDLRYDAGVYYILGTSLAEGKGYRLLNEPGEIRAIQYPPLLPLIVAAHQRALGTSDPMVAGHALRITFFFLFTMYVAGAYGLARHYLTSGYAFLAALVCALSLLPIFMSDILFAEIPFGLVSLSFFLCKAQDRRPIYSWLTALFAVAAYLLRTAGIALLAAWVVESLLRREFRPAVRRAVIALIPIIAWQSYTAHVQSGGDYTQPAYAYQRMGYQFYNVGYFEQLAYIDMFTPELGKASFRDIVKRVWNNWMVVPRSLGETVTADKSTWESQRQDFNKRVSFLRWPGRLVNLILAAFGWLVIGGVALLAARREWFVPTYTVMFLMVMCLTPWPGQFLRYLAACAPFITLGLFQAVAGVRAFCQRRRGRAWPIAGALSITLLLSVIFYQEISVVYFVYKWGHPVVWYSGEGRGPRFYRLFFYDQSWQELDAAIEWLKANAKATDMVATSVPHWVYLKTGLKAVMPPYEKNVKTAQELLDNVPIRYVIVDKLDFLDVSRRYAGATIQAYPQFWTEAYASPEGFVQIYQRVSP